MSDKTVHALNCPNCGGALEMFGGGRNVSTLTCKYCGSVLDVENEFKVLSQFKKVPLPHTPFRIGMRGKIKGVEFTIIGMIAYSCVKGRSTGEDTWVDFMLHSKTHGYAFLSYEENNCIFSRTTRNIPQQMNGPLRERSKFAYNGTTYTVYDRYNAYVTFVQGELTWIAKQGDVSAIIDAIAPPYALSREKRGMEIEYSISEYLDAKELYKAFDIKSKESGDFHPLKPFSSKNKAFSMVSFFSFLIALFIMIVIEVAFDGHKVQNISFTGKSATVPIEIKDTSHLVALSIRTNVDNNWIYYDISVQDAQGNEVYALGKEVSYYHGYEDGESWSEGSKNADAYFKVKTPGTYTLYFDAPEYPRPVSATIEVQEGAMRSKYFVILSIMSLIFGLFYPISYFRYQSRLWKHLQSDDDD